MKKIFYYATLSVTALLLGGCSSTPTKVDKGVIHASTFSFVSAGARTAEFAENRGEVHTMIQQALAKNLAAKGVKAAASGGDVTVAYLLIVGNNVSTVSVADYFGYGRDTSGLQDKAQDAYSANKNPNYFEAGTLVIDVIDGRTYKLLWRTYITKPVLRNIPAEVRSARIQEAVDEALADLRVAR